MKILLGIPTAGSLPVEFVIQLSNLASKHEITQCFIARSVPHIAREQMAGALIKGNFDALLFLDDDMIFPADVADRLADLDVPIASAMCFKRVPPYTPCVYPSLKLNGPGLAMEVLEFDKLPKEPFDVDGAGAACMLIRREVFENVKPPHFLPLPLSGEDLAFCIRANQAGYRVRIDPRIRVGHLETRPIYAEHYITYKGGIHL